MATPVFIAWRSSDRFHLVTVAVLVAVLAGLITLLYVVYSVTRVEGDSMAPALEPEDRVLFTRGYGQPRAGDIVRFEVVQSDGQTARLIKRVVAVPGDTVEIIGDTAVVNGEVSTVAPTALIGDDIRRLGMVVVPEGQVYVLGDNRPVSLDSRFIGTIPLSAVLGKAVAVIVPLRRFRVIDE